MYTKHQWNCAPWHPFHYVVNLPKDYSETTTYPLVIFLHGAGERGDDLEVASRHGYMRYVREEGREYPFLFVAPQCDGWNYWGCYTESLLHFIDYICDAYPVDRARPRVRQRHRVERQALGQPAHPHLPRRRRSHRPL